MSPHASWTELGVPATAGEGLIAAAQGQAVKRPVIFECVGAPGVLQSLAQAAPRGARIVVAGVCMEVDPIEPFVFITKEIELRFVLGYSPAEFGASLHNLAEGVTALQRDHHRRGQPGRDPRGLHGAADRQAPDQDHGGAGEVESLASPSWGGSA